MWDFYKKITLTRICRPATLDLDLIIYFVNTDLRSLKILTQIIELTAISNPPVLTLVLRTHYIEALPWR